MAGSFNEGSSHTRIRYKYQVFLSFRGEDVRKRFVDHLHHALIQKGISTFHDDSALERGSDIQPKLYEAIESSRLSIVTFSSGYATSRWCLDELVKIMECRTSFGHIVLPVFYDVNPSVVRSQSGVYGLAFEAHKVRFEDDLHRVEKWRKALREAADLAGFPLQNQADGHEARFIQNIIKEVMKKFDQGRLNVPRFVVGIESLVGGISKWLQDGSKDTEVGVIYGLGGVGKTTIAKIVYNNNCDNFDGHSFLADIRRVSTQDNGFVRLQRQLISNISESEMGEIHNIPEGMIKISQVIRSRRILLILDDVDELGQLYGMFDCPEWFFPGSKVIITTRNQHLRNARMPVKEFQVCTLNAQKSTQLFCLRAFGHEYPLQRYMKVSEQFIRYCGGLPLALEVLASSLSGKDLKLWENQLAKLEDFPNKKIHDVFNLSFDSIEDENDRDIFLHIAFFLVGVAKSYAFMILEGCDLYTEIGFQNLVDRCLVTIDDHYNVMMHQLIQEMGREVVRQEAYNEPGRRSRLKNRKDTCNVLRNKEGTRAIKGLCLDFPTPNNDMTSEDFYSKDDHIQKRTGLACILPTHSRRVQLNLESVTTDAFTEMKNINLLQLTNVQLRGSYEEFPKSLKCLWWKGCPLETVPGDFDLYKLVVLDMRNSSLVQAWEGIKFLGALKILNLSNSPFLTDTPDFSSAVRLKWIILIDCVSLVTVHESIGSLKKLTYLNLKGCKYLRRFPESMGELCSLKILNLSGCSHLLKVPDKIESSITLWSNPVSRHVLTINNSSLLPGLVPTSPRVSFDLFPFLKSLTLEHCGISQDAVFDNFSRLRYLKSLDLSDNPICVINKNLGQLTELRYIRLTNCTNLQSISTLRANCSVTTQGCLSLKTIMYLQGGPVSIPSYIYAYDCPNLVDIGGVVKLESTSSMDANRATYLGYPNLESFRSNERISYGPSRGLYQGGTYSVFLQGDHTEKWFTEIIVGMELVYTVPSFPDHQIRAFNLCCVYECGSSFETVSGYLEIKNVSRKWEWLYFPSINPVYRKVGEGRDITLLTHWCCMEHRELKAGDELQILFSLDHGNDFPMKYGIKILYEDCESCNREENSNDEEIQDEEGDTEQEELHSVAVWYHNTFRKNVDLSLFGDQSDPGVYFLETNVFNLTDEVAPQIIQR